MTNGIFASSRCRLPSVLMPLLSLLLAAPGWCAEPPKVAASVPATKVLRVYHVGNSLTGSILLERLHQLFAVRGIDYQFGSQLSGGKSLMRQWNYRNEPKMKWISWETNQPDGSAPAAADQWGDKTPKRFGLYDKALKEHTWDVIALQSFEAPLGEDAEAFANFIQLARQASPKAKFLIIAGYPRRFGPKDGIATVDLEKVWTQPYDFNLEDTSRKAKYGSMNRAYYARLHKLLKDRFPGVPIAMASFGDVLLAMDQAIRAGQLPGLAALADRVPAMVPGWKEGDPVKRGVNTLYADNYHLTPTPHTTPTLGVYATALTLYAALSGQSPVGLPGSIYGLDDKADAALIAATQKLVWQVAQQHARAKDKEQGAKGMPPAANAAVVQPDKIPGNWKLTPQPLPPIDEILKRL